MRAGGESCGGTEKIQQLGLGAEQVLLSLLKGFKKGKNPLRKKLKTNSN